ncbi:hypothetical protein M514_01741 [Trichuris suis]|uniref:Uncharacterized protein n=1 Tax=Trichuris suis TaxID=68888 RepID=A0A085MJ34_9BILA|nr:hypothetical protein M513_01741 [Trichuris suis]KFD72620.1 hypothetical protein M514_01741 [Trichuris suis]
MLSLAQLLVLNLIWMTYGFSAQCFVLSTISDFQKLLNHVPGNVPTGFSLSSSWKSIFSTLLPKLLPERTAGIMRNVLNMVDLVRKANNGTKKRISELGANITENRITELIPAEMPNDLTRTAIHEADIMKSFIARDSNKWKGLIYQDPPINSIGTNDASSETLAKHKSNHTSEVPIYYTTRFRKEKQPNMDYFQYYYNNDG